VTGTSEGGHGWSTNLRLILDTPGGRVFVKGLKPDDSPIRAHQRDRLVLGAELAPYVNAVSPPLLFQVEAEGWDVTGWPALPGRPFADLSPGSPDILVVTGLLAKVSEIPAPPTLTVTARDEWARWADDPDLLDGDALVHADPHGANFVVDGDRGWFVDWGWAVRGPAWMTAALLILSMTGSGWEPGAAEDALSGVPGWTAAPLGAVTAFAETNMRMWDRAVERAPTGARKTRRDIARVWADHRTGCRTGR
jgi:hypothetical protein